MDSNHQPPD